MLRSLRIKSGEVDKPYIFAKLVRGDDMMEAIYKVASRNYDDPIFVKPFDVITYDRPLYHRGVIIVDGDDARCSIGSEKL